MARLCVDLEPKPRTEATMQHHLAKAAEQRHRAALARAESALHELSSTGEPITFAAVARRGKVSTDFLYKQPVLRSKITELRQRSARLGTHSEDEEPGVSTSAAVRALSSQIKDLKRRHALEIAELRSALAVAQGENLKLRRAVSDTPRA